MKRMKRQRATIIQGQLGPETWHGEPPGGNKNVLWAFPDPEEVTLEIQRSQEGLQGKAPSELTAAGQKLAPFLNTDSKECGFKTIHTS